MNLPIVTKLMCAGLVVLWLSSTGCMMTPGNNEVINSIYEPVGFTGATTQPNRTIYLYARRNASAA